MRNLNLSERERKVLIAGVVFLVLLLLYLGVNSMVERYEKLDQRIRDTREEIKKISRLRQEYLEAHRELSGIKAKLDEMDKGFSVLSFIEDLAQKQNVREDIGSAKPKRIPLNEKYEENLVEIKMVNISLRDLVEFIFKIENSGYMLKVRRLRVKTRFDNRDLLNVTLQVSTYMRRA